MPRTLYHATRMQFAPSIQNLGLAASPKGRLGPGIYFVRTYAEAQTIAMNRIPYQGHGDHPVVLTVDVADGAPCIEGVTTVLIIEGAVKIYLGTSSMGRITSIYRDLRSKFRVLHGSWR